MSFRKKPPYIIPIFISFLGCPFTCLYCQQEKITGQSSRLPSVEEVQERIRAYLQTKHPQKYSHSEVAFYGGTFTGLKIEMMEMLLQAVAPFVATGDIRSIRASTKPDYISAPVLALLKKHHVDTIELGVQSMSDEVLREVGRGYQVKQVEEAVALLRAHGFQIGIQLMQGLPGADEAEALESAHRTIKLKPDFVRIYPTVVLEDTALAMLYRQGRYQPWSLDKALDVCRKLKILFDEAQIPIIKMGLEFSSDEEKGIVAGPYHPNFRQKVMGLAS